MKEANKYIIIYFAGFVMCLIPMFIVNRCEDRPINTFHTETTKIYDSTERRIQPTATPASVRTQTVPIPTGLDSAAIVKLLENFFAVHSFTQTGRDTNISWTISNDVSQNRITDQRFDYKLLQPKVVQSTTVTTEEKRRIAIFGGVLVTGSQNSFGIGPKASLLTKKDVLVSYGYDLVNKQHYASTQFKIKWK